MTTIRTNRRAAAVAALRAASDCRGHGLLFSHVKSVEIREANAAAASHLEWCELDV